MFGRILMSILDLWFSWRFRRTWSWGRQPHFFDHCHDAWSLLRGRGNPLVLFRGFNAGMLVQAGDSVLDIGCGDGFFPSRFYGADVDAVDIDRDAIAHARKINRGPNYFLLDAVKDAFPRDSYDVIVWDGAIAHLSREHAETVLGKIADCSPRWFCGSEGLHDQSPDHLQILDEDSLRQMLMQRFDRVEISVKDNMAYWRATNRWSMDRPQGAALA